MIRKLCNVADLPAEGSLRAFVGAGSAKQPALCVTVADGQVYAFDDACPHQGASLSAGRLDGQHVVCPIHSWQWDVTTGHPCHAGDPALCSYEVRQYGHEVFVRIPTPPTEQNKDQF